MGCYVSFQHCQVSPQAVQELSNALNQDTIMRSMAISHAHRHTGAINSTESHYELPCSISLKLDQPVIRTFLFDFLCDFE